MPGFLSMVTLTADPWPWPSNSSERGTEHVFRVNLVQIRSAVHTQTKNHRLTAPKTEPSVVHCVRQKHVFTEKTQQKSLQLWSYVRHPLPTNRHHRSNGDCLEGKRENYQVCSVQYCVQQLCRCYTYNTTHACV